MYMDVFTIPIQDPCQLSPFILQGPLQSDESKPEDGAGLSLSFCCRRNSPAEEEVIAALILAGNHSVKDVQQTVFRLCT